MIGLSYPNNKEKEWLDKKKMCDVGNAMHESRGNKKTMCELSGKDNANQHARILHKVKFKEVKKKLQVQELQFNKQMSIEEMTQYLLKLQSKNKVRGQ